MDDLLKKVEEVLPTLEGWCTFEKGRALAELVAVQRPKVCVEIGVFGGRSLIAMALACKKFGGHVHGIDPWTAGASLEGDSDQGNKEYWGNLDYAYVYRSFVKAVTDQDLLEVCDWYRMGSERAVHLFGQIDVLHIDGNHTEEVSCRDVKLYAPKIPRGGHLWFDDTDWKTTSRAQQLIRRDFDLMKMVGTCALYRKK